MIEIASKEDFVRLEEKIDRMEDIINQMSLFLISQTVDVKELSNLVGLKVSTLYNDAYRHYLPNFGKSDYPEGNKRWKRETVLNWEAIPIAERKAMWEGMSRKQREQILNS